MQKTADSPVERQTQTEDDEINLSFFNSPVNIQVHPLFLFINPLQTPDYQRFPLLKKANSKVCVLRAGEILYLPSFW